MANRKTEKPIDRVAHRREVLDALSRYQKQGHFSGDQISLGHAFAHESDRALVIICGSLIEDMVAEKIIRALPNGAEMRKELTRPGSPLSSFGAMATMALAMGIIDEGDAELLDVLKAMRNACAHSRKDIDFATPELKAALLLMIGGEGRKLVEATNNTVALRLIFVNVISYVQNLIRGLAQVDAQARATAIINEAWEAVAAEHAAEEAEKRQSSPETPTTPPDLGDPQDPTD